jgi:16S rRNA (adenine1518-N6/adenine1519-N6)-dimethyltransferase
MTLTEIRARLRELGVHPSRRLGQNFLHDQNLARRIVELAELPPDEPALEIGPGLGALTEFIPNSERLTLIEKDHRLAGYLRERFPQATVIEADALEAIQNPKSKIQNYLGNLPYSVASPLIVRLCERDLRPSRMVFTVQREVADRLIARPSTPDYGLLTLLTQPFYEIRIARKIPPSVFWPEPKVASAVVTMLRRPSQPFSQPQAETFFREILHQAWQKRRKQLGTIFRDGPCLDLDPAKRPEEVPVEGWVGACLGGTPSPASAIVPLSTDAGDGVPSAEEELDVVNERNEVISRELRSEVHRRGLSHRAVHIFVWNRHGELLLQKRSALKDVAPNTWDSSAAGHLSTGEDYDTAARRECQEELGIRIPLCPVRSFSAVPELGWEFVQLYEGKSEGPFQFPASEISEVRWWKTTEIDSAIQREPHAFAASFRYLWEHRKAQEN